MLAVLLFSLAGLGQANPLDPPEPRFSSIVLTNGICSGFLPLPPRRRVEIGFDWETLDYRVTIYRASRWDQEEGPFRTTTLSEDQFEDILAGVLSRGLAELPPQPNPEGPDVYRLNTGLIVYHGRLAWENQASNGCTAASVDVEPTPDERRRFADIVGFINDALTTLELEPGCALDWGFSVQLRGQRQGRAFLTALEHALRSPHAKAIDRRRAEFLVADDHYEVRFAWRGLQDPPYGYRRHFYGVRLDRRTLDASDASAGPVFVPDADLQEKRREFLEDHPELPPRLRRLVAAGWIVRGMTPEMVIATWGEPEDPSDGEYERHEGSIVPRFDPDGRLLWLAAPQYYHPYDSVRDRWRR